MSFRNLSSMGHAGNLVNTPAISDSITESLSNSNTLTIFTFGLNSIFESIKSSPFAGLESVGLLKYVDIGQTVKGFSMPAPINLAFLSKGTGKGR